MVKTAKLSNLMKRSKSQLEDRLKALVKEQGKIATSSKRFTNADFNKFNKIANEYKKTLKALSKKK